MLSGFGRPEVKNKRPETLWSETGLARGVEFRRNDRDLKKENQE
jgi:hypothetical protein